MATMQSHTVAPPGAAAHGGGTHPLLSLLLYSTLFTLLFWVDPAWAQDKDAGKGFEPLQDASDAILGFMTGPFARTIAAISVAGLGYLGLSGRMAGSKAFTIIAALVLIFGAATIVDTIADAVK